VQRLTIFAKGNADVRDSLLALIEDGVARWNGINVALATRQPGWRARVIHEVSARSDVLASADGAVPAGSATFASSLGAFAAERQCSPRLYAGEADVVVLSIQADVMNRLAVHRGDGRALYPHDLDNWPTEHRARFVRDYADAPPLDSDAAMQALARVVARLHEAGDPAILIYNMSPIVPWERIHCYAGVPETLAIRIRRFNLALVELSRLTGVSIVDVDAVVARGGADRLKLDAVSLTAEGCRLVAEEVVRILVALGRLPEATA